MASPFSVFRKNQKVWMAGITIMAMIAFVFLHAHDDEFFQRPGGRDEPVVRTTKFGNIAAGQLQMLRLNRMVFNEFLQGSRDDPGGQQAADEQRFSRARVIGTVGNGEVVRTVDVVNKWLFAREAEAMGITVDDKAFSFSPMR